MTVCRLTNDHLYRIALVAICIKTTFFYDKFGVHFENEAIQAHNHNDRVLHSIVYLQVAIISQALIFITRSHGFFFMERPSFALMGAFCIAQLVSSIIAAYGDWGFSNIEPISGGWIGIVWIWVSTRCRVFCHPTLTPYRRTSSGSSLSTSSSSR